MEIEYMGKPVYSIFLCEYVYCQWIKLTEKLTEIIIKTVNS